MVIPAYGFRMAKNSSIKPVGSYFHAISSEEIVKLVLLSMNAHYQDNARKIEALLYELKNMDQHELVEVFQGLREASPIEDAISILTNWIEAKISKTTL
jgi:hypothetical protein